MALSGSFGVGTNGNITGLLEWSGVQDKVNNYTDISFTLKFRRTNTTAGGTFGSVATWYVWVNGQQTSASHSYSYPSSMAWVQVHSGSVRVYHDANGAKSVRIEVDGNTDTHDVNYVDTWHTLDTIPRASTFAGGIDFTAGVDNFWMSIARADGSFHHTVEMFVQHTYDANWDKVGERTWVGDSGWWNFTEAETKQIYTTNAGYEERPLLIRVRTYDAGHTVQIGTEQDKVGKVRAYATGVAAFNDFNIGTKSIPATILNYNANFEYDVTFIFGNLTIPYGLQGQNFTMTLTDDHVNTMYAQIPNGATGYGEVVVRTKYKGIFIEDGLPVSHSKYFNAYVVNSEPVFDTIGYYDSNAAMVTLTGDNKAIVQNKSYVTAQVANAWKAQARNSSRITKYVATLNGVTLTVNEPFATDINFDFGVVNSNIHLNLEITAYDSRGFTKKVTKQVTIIPYAAPVVQTQALRDNGFGSNVALTLSGSIAPLNVNGTNKNSLVPSGVNYKWRQLPAGAWSANIQFLGQTLTMPNFTTTSVALTMDTTLAFEIVVQVTDQLGNTTITMQVPVGTPIMFVDEVLKSVGIGKFPSRSGALELAGKLYYTDGEERTPIGKYIDGSASKLSTGADLNSNFDTGLYMGDDTVINRPPVSAWFYMLVFKHNDNFCSQTCWDLWTNKTYERRKINTIWNPWKLIGGSEGGTISPVSPWTHYDGAGGYQTPQYWKTSGGMVSLQGLFKGNGAGLGSWLGVLPVGFRPAAQALYHVNSEGGMCRVDIQSDGVIIWSSGGGSGWMSLEGISFMAEN
jgi:hypothetical protein